MAGALPRLLAEQKIFLVTLFGFVGFGRSADFLNFRVAAAGNVLITGLDDDVTLLTQRLQVIAKRGLHTLRIKVVHDFVFDFVFWLLAGYAFYQTELNMPHSTVHSFTDALFLAFTTSTTVGYSPMKAVSPEGQIVAGLVIFVGLGLLTAASSRLTSLWIEATSEQAQDELLLDIRDQLRASESRLAAIEATLGIRKPESPSPTLPIA